jgi:cell division topological specificity factor
MKLRKLFQRGGSAFVARERLQVLLAHERSSIGQSDLIAVLREEILAVIAKHVATKPDKVHVKMQRGESVSTLEVEVEIPACYAMPGVASGLDAMEGVAGGRS